MKKQMLLNGMILTVLLVVSPAGAVTGPVAETHQCWDFNVAPIVVSMPNLYVAPPSQAQNHFGTPAAMITDMSGQGVGWDDRGYMYGDEFKIIIDVPNQPIPNPYKELTLDLTFQGQISFMWVADAVTGERFDLVFEEPGYNDPWQTLHQVWKFHPNPREEVIVIGFKGIDVAMPAMLDHICIDTICVPEPTTLAILGLGAGFIVRKRRR